MTYGKMLCGHCTAADDGNVNIIGFLLDSLEETGHADTSAKLLLAQDYFTHNAWHLAANEGQIREVEVLKTLWEWAK